MRPSDIVLAKEISLKLDAFRRELSVPGLRLKAYRSCLISQIIDSIRRIKYISTIRDKEISESSLDPSIETFNPLKAAILQKNNGNIDESFWLIFLATHFGKHKRTGWSLMRTVYAGSDGNNWTWHRVRDNFDEFSDWLSDSHEKIQTAGMFSNHRKYESRKKIAKVIASYIEWVETDHATMVKNAISIVGEDPNELFHHLYLSMSQVNRFGRTAKFDFLTMVGKIGLIHIEPGLTYMNGATGPLSGVRLLFENQSLTPKQGEKLLAIFSTHLDLYFGMQIIEDALCNWQKNPTKYEYFSG